MLIVEEATHSRQLKTELVNKNMKWIILTKEPELQKIDHDFCLSEACFIQVNMCISKMTNFFYIKYKVLEVPIITT